MQYAYDVEFLNLPHNPSCEGFHYFSEYMDAEPFTAMDAAHDWFCINGKSEDEDEDDFPFVGEYACKVYARKDEHEHGHVIDACEFRGCHYVDDTPDVVKRIH